MPHDPTSRPDIRFRASSQANDFLPMSRRSTTEFAGARLAWQSALQQADITLDDLDLVETHDCFTIAELLEYEAMGLTGPGEGNRAIDEGWVAIDGKLPVNPSGGLKAKGHPIGATGVSMHVMAAMPTGRTRPGEMQVASPRFGGGFQHGSGLAAANYVSILERSA